MYDLGWLMPDILCQTSAARCKIEGLKQDSINVIPLMGANLRKKRIVYGLSCRAYADNCSFNKVG